MAATSSLVLVLIFVSSYKVLAADYLTFLNSESYSVIQTSTTYSPRIDVPNLYFPIGSSHQEYVYVVTNGLIEFGTPFYETITEIPQSGVSRHFVAPFATEIFYNNQEVRYDVRYDTFLDGDSEMVAVSSFLRALLDNSGFNGQWMLVVDWYNVYSTFSFDGVNRFQGVLITDGTDSYAVFIYNCQHMHWSRNVVIGWQSGYYYRSHPYSGWPNAKNISCLNPDSTYNTVVYQLTKTSICYDSEFGCSRGNCVPSSVRCDGSKDCADGEDEIACGCPEFQCGSGECVLHSDRCNGNANCDDKSDENNCCNSTEFQCTIETQCISSFYRCDGSFECSDNSDEYDCPCGSQEFKCDNGQCIKENHHCDGDYECEDESDESGCVDMVMILSFAVGFTATISCVSLPICVFCTFLNCKRRRTQQMNTEPTDTEMTYPTTYANAHGQPHISTTGVPGYYSRPLPHCNNSRMEDQEQCYVQYHSYSQVPTSEPYPPPSYSTIATDPTQSPVSSVAPPLASTPGPLNTATTSAEDSLLGESPSHSEHDLLLQ